MFLLKQLILASTIFILSKSLKLVAANNTVDREMFAVKKFSPLAQVAKILRAKICLRRIIRVTLPAVAKIKHAEIYHAKKKERENFPIYGSYNKVQYI